MGDYGAEQVKHRQLMWQKPRQSHWRFYLTLYNPLLNVPVWWNWYTRRIQNPLLRGVPVRVRALVPAHIVGPIRRLFLGAFLCLKHQFLEKFLEKYSWLSEEFRRVGPWNFCWLTVAAWDICKSRFWKLKKVRSRWLNIYQKVFQWVEP